jgi:WD40 repeat protein
MDFPGPPGAAWTQYRARHGVRDRLAAVIAERAKRNFLVAAMAAVPLSTTLAVTDPAAEGFDPARIPSGVGEALSKYLDRLPEQRQERDRELLTALAYARGAGLDDPAWLSFAAALGYDASIADLDALRRSPAADYLLQTTTTKRGARPVTRLFHQALTDELLAPRHQPSDESAVLDMLLGQAERAGWQERYLREHAAEHAAAAGRLDQLLEDPLYLLAVDPARLVPHLDTVRSAPARATAAVYRQSAHLLARLDLSMRASQLELTAHSVGCRNLAARIANAAPDRPWQTRWSHGRRATGHQVITGHDGRVGAVAAGALPDGTPVIISGGWDGTVRVWRTADGTPVGKPMTGHRSNVMAVTAGALPDGTPVIISGGGFPDSTLRVWRLGDGTPVGEPMTGHRSNVMAVAAGALPDGTPVIISGGEDGTLRVWRTADGTPVGEPMTGHDGPIGGVAAGALPDGTPVIISGGGRNYADGTVRMWRLGDGTPVGEPLTGHDGRVGAVAAGALPDGTPVIISGGADDGTVRMWRLADGTSVGEPLTGQKPPLWAVAAGALPDGTPVIISGGGDGTVRMWRLGDGTPVGEPMTGHDGPIGAVAAGALPDGTPVIISGGNDGVRVWRIADGTPAGEPLTGHDGEVNAVAAGALPDGAPVIISCGWDAVRVWRLADGTPVGEPLTGHDGPVWAVAAGALPDRTPVIISGGHDGVRVWRTADGTPVGEPLTGHDGPVRVWRLRDGTPVGEPLIVHDGEVYAVAAGALPDGTPVIISAVGGGLYTDGTVRVWRLDNGTSVGEPLTGHSGQVRAVAAGALPDGTPVIIGGGRGGVRMWRTGDGTPLVPSLNLPKLVQAVAVHGDVVITAAGVDIAVHQPALPRSMR